MNLSLSRLASVAIKSLGKESSILQTLNEDVRATVKRMSAEDPGISEVLEKAYGYAVFPSVGKAGAVIGGAFGKGEVFERGKLIGYAGLVQVTIGVQVGGDTFSQIIALENKETLDRFKKAKTAFAANASAVLVKAGAAKSARFENGAAVFISTEGGLMLEAALGAQKFIFKPAVLGRTESAPDPEPEHGEEGGSNPAGEGRQKKDRRRAKNDQSKKNGTAKPGRSAQTSKNAGAKEAKPRAGVASRGLARGRGSSASRPKRRAGTSKRNPSRAARRARN